MSVFEHPWQSGLFQDTEARAILAPEAQLKRMLLIESGWAQVLGDIGRVSPQIAAGASQAIAAARVDMDVLRSGTARDGLAVPALVRHLKSEMPAELHPAIHSGLTSQDVIDTELVLALKPLFSLFEGRLHDLEAALDAVTRLQGQQPLMGRTRMQAAVGIKVADRVAGWARPLARHRARLERLRGSVLCLQFGGAAGTRDVLGDDGDAAAKAFATRLGLRNPDAQWHSTRDKLVEFAGWLALVTGSLGKMGHDISLMAQQGLDEVEISGGGTSSAMPHKQNPILAELLVTLARFNATQIAGMHGAMVHEQERSGAAWALEWMILPEMIQATARSLGAATELIARIKRIGSSAR